MMMAIRIGVKIPRNWKIRICMSLYDLFIAAKIQYYTDQRGQVVKR
jgi:hypothetical protein